MTKIGILTFHYSNNYGGVLQALSLQNAIKLLGYDVEVVNFVPSSYGKTNIRKVLGLRRNIFKNKLKDMNIINILKKISIIINYSENITHKFNTFRNKEMRLSEQVDEKSLKKILINYDAIIVGSDQIWNPGQRKRPEYFLEFGEYFNGKKISYAADSQTKEININDLDNMYNLRKALKDFSFISVRNMHSYEFVKSITNKEVYIVADPTIIYDFEGDKINIGNEEDYLLTYVLGKEIKGTHHKALEKIKKEFYGNLPIYSIMVPTINVELWNLADKAFYDLDPNEWINMFKNAKFIYTDSFHGVLFALKYHKPFLAYYTDKVRGERLIDLGNKYNIEKYIVQNVEEITSKNSLNFKIDFGAVDKMLKQEKKESYKFLAKALSEI